jgi:hypothetical protein
MVHKVTKVFRVQTQALLVLRAFKGQMVLTVFKGTKAMVSKDFKVQEVKVPKVWVVPTVFKDTRAVEFKVFKVLEVRAYKVLRALRRLRRALWSSPPSPSLRQ